MLADLVVDYAYAARARARHVRTRWDAGRYGDGELAPVVLIPGVYETWEYLRPVARRLHRQGHPVHVLPVLGHNRLPITRSAELAYGVLEQRDLTDVRIVGHSKGGLIGKLMMAKHDVDAKRITRMVTVCTPFSGSPLASFAPGRTLREFRPRNELVAALAREAGVNARITSIGTKWDQVVPTGSHLDGAENLRVAFGGHFRALGTPAVLEAIAVRVAA